MPDSSIKALKIFNINENEIRFDSIKKNNYLKFNSNLNKIDILFKKILK